MIQQHWLDISILFRTHLFGLTFRRRRFDSTLGIKSVHTHMAPRWDSKAADESKTPDGYTQRALDKCRLEIRVRELENVIKEQCDALRESTKLLQRTRPPRPAIPHERKLKVAADQRWRCADPFGECVLYKCSDGTFDAASLFEIDHSEPWHTAFRSVGTLQALCVTCHNRKTREDRLRELEAAETEKTEEGKASPTP